MAVNGVSGGKILAAFIGLTVAYYVLFQAAGKSAPPASVRLPPVPVPPGTMTQAEVDVIQRGNPDELARTALDGTHGKTFVAAAAARLAGLGDARALQIGQYALTLPRQEDATR